MRWGWKPYVPVARRRANAARHAARMQKKGEKVQPIHIEGRTIARTFWGKAWCDNLEGYSDFENRLPRGRTYVRNGSVIDLKIKKGEVAALVSGSDIYQIKVSIKPVAAALWKQIIRSCSGSIDSLMDLLQGRFADAVMEKLTSQESGLFPGPQDISFNCSCPDWAYMCKHVAAVLYGIGARLDEEPELLFILRDADHLELLSEATKEGALENSLQGGDGRALDGDDLESVFGIDLDTTDETASATTTKTKPKTSRRRQTARKAPDAGTKKTATAKKKSTARRETKPRPVGKTTRSTAAKQDASAKTSARKKSARKKSPSKKATTKASQKKVSGRQNPGKKKAAPSTAKKSAKKRATKKQPTKSGRPRKKW